MSGLDGVRAEIQAINANLSHVRRSSSGAKHLHYVDGQPVWSEDPYPVVSGRSMFPYKSTAMAVDPSEVPQVQEQLRKEGLFVEFDRQGRPEITSTKQQDALAKAFGMKTGRDGYGHLDQHGRFQNTGRRRGDEIAEGRAKIRKARETLEGMPDNAPLGAIDKVLAEYDIVPNAENTG